MAAESGDVEAVHTVNEIQGAATLTLQGDLTMIIGIYSTSFFLGSHPMLMGSSSATFLTFRLLL